MHPSEYAGLYELEESLWWFVGMRRIVDTLLRNRARHGVQPGWRCLDADCGAGFNALDLARRYDWRVFPCDISTHAIEYSARREVPRLARCDITALPYPAAAFDCVVCLDVLYMFSPERIGAALAELHRVLRPGGLLVTRTASLEMLRGRHSEWNAEARRYSLPEFRRHLERARFHVEQATYANALLTLPALLKRRVLEPLRLVDARSDVRPVPHWLDRLFLNALEMERRLIASGLRMPFGTSLIALASKRV